MNAAVFEWEFTCATDDLFTFFGLKKPNNLTPNEQSIPLWASYQTAHMAYIAQLNTVNLKAWEAFSSEYEKIDPFSSEHNRIFLRYQETIYDDLILTQEYQQAFSHMINTFLAWLKSIEETSN